MTDTTIGRGVRLSNKACRWFYFTPFGKRMGRVGGCDCGPGRCWYLEQVWRREDGAPAIAPEDWMVRDEPAEAPED